MRFVLWEGGQQDDRDLSVADAQSFGQFQPPAVAQADIKEDESRHPLLEELLHFGSALCVLDRVTVLRQNSVQHLAEDGIVFHDQDRSRLYARTHVGLQAPG